MQPNHAFFSQRRAGVLLHPTSLPTTVGNGDLGPAAYQFIDFLAAADVSVWQMLPIQQPHLGYLSPYQCQSIYAGNRLLISLEDLVTRGWLPSCAALPTADDHDTAVAYRLEHLCAAKTHFFQHATAAELATYQAFIARHSAWLEDYALFAALKADQQGQPWWMWPPALRDRDSAALEAARDRLQEALLQHRFEQFCFFQQWEALKTYANERSIFLLGDIPIFVAEDSAEVWTRHDLFLLDGHGRPTVVAGVPPDYFCQTGQRWGNPVYHWDKMQAEDFQWWVQRFEVQQLLFDALRIDHFRGFIAAWHIPAHHDTAEHGEWVASPGHALFARLRDTTALMLIAEDLGVMTPEVAALRDTYGLPGIKILQFAFDSDAYNPYLPHNHIQHSVVYTGTHDNDTTLSWFTQLPEWQQQRVCDYLDTTPEHMPWCLIDVALASAAQLAIIPMQDILSLDGAHRMNSPGTTDGNWQWRFASSQLTEEITQRLRGSIQLYGRG